MLRSRQFKRFWNWFGRSKCPRAVLDLLVNFHHELSIFPTRWPWASEDVKVPDSRTVNICLSRWFWVRVIPSLGNVAWIHVAYLLLETFIKISQKLNCNPSSSWWSTFLNSLVLRFGNYIESLVDFISLFVFPVLVTCDGMQETCFFQISAHSRTYVCIFVKRTGRIILQTSPALQIGKQNELKRYPATFYLFVCLFAFIFLWTRHSLPHQPQLYQCSSPHFLKQPGNY